MPNAWPSETMLRQSSFVRAAVNKPPYYYLQVLVSLSPCHVIGIILGAVLALNLVKLSWRWWSSQNSTVSMSSRNVAFYKLVVFSLWPASFLAGLMLLGVRGAGYQSRFLLPLLPASAILCSVAVNIFTVLPSRNGSELLLLLLVVVLCLMYSAMHSVYYGVLYAPLFAELDFSLVDIVRGILTSPYSPPSGRDSFEDTVKFMAHFGLNRRVN